MTTSPLPQRPLGQTGLHISTLGLGTVKFGRNTQVKYPQPFLLPDDKNIQQLLSICQTLHINLLDTAPAYGSAEQRIGKLLPGNRDAWVLCSKAGESFNQNTSSYQFDQTHLHQSVKKSLRALRTEYLDIVLIHSNGDDQKIIEQYDVFGSLAALKQQGYIRAYGMSTKTIVGGQLTVQHADVVMVTYNPQDTKQIPVLEAAHKANKGVLIKKGLASGSLTQHEQKNPVAHAMQCIFKQPSVSSLVIGTLNPQHLQENAALCQKVTTPNFFSAKTHGQ